MILTVKNTMNSLEAIEKYIKPEELKSILRKRRKHDEDIGGISNLFYLDIINQDFDCPESLYWYELYNFLDDIEISGKGPVYIEEWKTIKEWLNETDQGIKFLDRLRGLIDTTGSFYGEGYEFENLKSFSAESAVFLIKRFLDNMEIYEKDPIIDTCYFYLEKGRFPNDFDN